MVDSKDHGIEDLTQFATEVIRRSGEEALAYYGKGRPAVKFDENLVTEAELHLREFFQDQILAHFPEHQIYQNDQENRGYTHEGKRYLWVYDPIDGVANFQAGIPIWGTSLALLENFWPIFSVFFMPSTSDIFHARAGEKAFRGKAEMRISSQEDIDDQSLLLTYSRFHHHYHSTFPGKIRDLGCTTAHVCYVAMGRAEAALIANESYQGLATGHIIIEAAGGKIYKIDGGKFHLNEYLDGKKIDDPLLVAAPGTYPQVRNYLEEFL